MSSIYVGKEYITVGEKVRLITADGEFLGRVQAIDEVNHKVVLRKVSLANTGKKFHGVLTFFENEVIKAEIIKNNSPSSPEKIEVELKNPENPVNKPSLGLYAANLKKNESERFGAVGICETEVEYTDEHPNRRFQNSKLNIIHHQDKLFTEAVDYIKSKKIIGIAVEGLNIGRNGKLFWMQIDTDTTVFLFDLLTLDKEFIAGGLGEIMENSKILKVMHDCRQFSDALSNQYGFKLVNLYDTQVADALIFKKNNDGKYPRHVRNLSRCLLDYLKLQPKDVYHPQTRANHAEDDQLIWQQRPLPRHLIDAAIKNVIYLRNLRIATMERFHSELIQGINVYLSDLRDATAQEIEESPNHLLPRKFQDLTTDFKANTKTDGYFYVNRNLVDESGFKLNSIRIPDPRYRFSRDSCHNGTYQELESKSGQDITNVLLNAKSEPNYNNNNSRLSNSDYSSTCDIGLESQSDVNLDGSLGESRFERLQKKFATMNNSGDARLRGKIGY